MSRFGLAMMLWGVGVGACAKTLPEPETATSALRVRPSWVANLRPYEDAMRTCLEGREAPRYVAFLDALPSGATAVTTVDAYGAVEHCAYYEGRVVRREPAPITAVDISAMGGALLSVGPEQPVVQVGLVLEEVVDGGRVLGWLYWPQPEGDSDGELQAAQLGDGEVHP
jgi:hypothetical protein